MPDLTRDQAVEGVGRLRVRWLSADPMFAAAFMRVEGVVTSYELDPDAVTIAVDRPSVARLTAPRTEMEIVDA